MFLDYYNLKEEPFGVTPDPRFLYLGSMHREALASLVYSIQADRGFAALIAKPGMGKTSLLFFLLEKLKSSARTAFLFQTSCEPETFMQELLAELEPGCHETDPVLIHEKLKNCLLREARAGRRVVVLIDEAQNLSGDVLESVRLLSDFETPRSKLIQIILSGQPELAEKLSRPELAQLSQRIATVCRLNALPRPEVDTYIEHRLRVAGCADPESLFSPGACVAIAEASEGIPRKINNLCFGALSLGYALAVKQVGADLVREAASDMTVSIQIPNGSEQFEAREPVEPAGHKWLDPLIADDGDAGDKRSEPISAAPTTWADTTSDTPAVLASDTFSVFEFQRAWPQPSATTRLAHTTAISNTFQHGSGGAAEAKPCAETKWDCGEKRADEHCEVPKGEAGQIPSTGGMDRLSTSVKNEKSAQGPEWPEPVRKPYAEAEGAQVSARKERRTWIQMLAAIVLLCAAVAAIYLWHTEAETQPKTSQQVPTQQITAAENAVNATPPGSEAVRDGGPRKGNNASTAPSKRRFSGRENAEVRLPELSTAVGYGSINSGGATEMKSTRPDSGIAPQLPGREVAMAGLGNGMSLQPPVVSVPRLAVQNATVVPGKLVKMVHPVYPAAARRYRLEGVVVLDAVIAEDGRVQGVRVLDGNSLLTGAAVEAVKQWRYTPYLVDGKPSVEHAKVKIVFSLAKNR